MRTKKRILSFTLAILLVVSMIPTISLPVYAASGTDEVTLDNMNALEALGIDTNVMPDGFDGESKDNPYGKDMISLNPVSELFTSEQWTESTISWSAIVPVYKISRNLKGHEGILTGTTSSFYSSAYNTTNKTKILDDETTLTTEYQKSYSAFKAASGNFNGKGMKGQIVTVAVGEYSKNGGLYMYFTDPLTGAVSDEPVELMSTEDIIGNFGTYANEDLATQYYQLQNYLQISAGDYDGDGIDEVAVYVPEQGNSHVAIYKLQTTSTSEENLYLDGSEWRLAWTYAFNESPYVSNMVSITSGDFNRDGTDDIALTWGTYYGPDYKTACKAAVLYGSKLGDMLQKNKSFSLNYANSEIVRAAFTYGDVNGDGTDELILGGQLVSDINKKVLSNRVIMMYNYDGDQDAFILSYSNNFKVIEDKDKQGNYPDGEDGLYYSSPASVVNIATVKMDGIGKAAYIYLDSVLYKYGNDGLEIAAELDQLSQMKDSRTDTQYKDYAEYGIVAADFNGDGKETIQVMQYFFPQTVTYKEKYWWWIFNLYNTITKDIPGKLLMHAIYSDGTNLIFNTKDCGESFKTYYTTVNTDKDTVYMDYTGEHYVTYTDPKVLAVLASSPYFSDIAIQEDSGNYLEGSTEYASSRGDSTGESRSHTLSVGAYVSFEQEFSFFGITVASMEAEVAYTHGFTWETEKVSTIEQTVTYGTATGEDAIAFYSIPMEVYVYKSYYPETDSSGNTIYKEQAMAVNIPHTAAVVTMPLSTYEAIAADYDDLPQITGNVLNHTVGKPTTYPSSVAEFAAGLGSGINYGPGNSILFNGDWAGVNYGGLGYVSQEIAMSNETSKSFSNSDAIDTKIGAGAGGVTVGVTAGYEYGYGSTTVTTNGSSFSGTVNNLPTGAEDYYYAWKLFAFFYNDGINTFPVVSYLVTDIKTPPELPKDFAQDISRTTDTQNCLTWSYSGGVAGFQIYRYYEFPEGSGSYELGPVIKASDFYKLDESTNTRYYRYIDGGEEDGGLYPYTDYEYQIRVIGTAQPTDSILSPVLVARTKTDVGYPVINLTTNKISVFPDVSSSVVAYIVNSEDYTQGAKFQWQKNVDGQWKDVSGYTKAMLTVANAGLDAAGEYRCRVNVIYESYYISAYSDIVTVEYSKRSSEISNVNVTEPTSTEKGPTFKVEVSHPYSDIQTPPTGTVTFEINNANYHKSYTKDIEFIGGKGIANVVTTKLPDGVYEITAYYSGSRIFKTAVSDVVPYLSGSSEGYLIDVTNEITYGNNLVYTLNKVTKNSGETIITPVKTGIDYKVYKPTQTLSYITINFWFMELTIPVWETTLVAQSGWVDGSTITAMEAGTFKLSAMDETNNEIASKNITVSKRNLTIEAIDKLATAKTSGATHPTVQEDLTVSQGSLAVWDQGPSDDILNKLGLYVKALRAGNEITIDDTTQPGDYTIVGAPIVYNQVIANYNVIFVEGTYTLTGETYEVAGEAKKLLGNDVGKLEVISPQNHQYWTTKYQNGTQIIFTATPDKGYAVAEWYIKNNTSNEYVAQNSTSNRLNYLMKSEPLDIKVEFTVKSNTLEYKVLNNKTESGEVVCVSSDALTSGAIVIEDASFDFMAVPKDGYHFVEWQKYVVGVGTTKPVGSIDEEGRHLVNVIMGDKSVILYAVFERDSYEITLGENLEAWYMDNIDNNISTGDDNGDELVTVQSGAMIKGSKTVTVNPSPGFVVVEDAYWYENGLLIEESNGLNEYEFIMMANTSIDVETRNKPVKIDFSIQNAGGEENTVDISINDEAVIDVVELNDIEGGSKIEFEANPAYGYLFDKWIINGVDDVKSGKTLIIGTLGSDMTVAAVFKNNQDYTIDASYDTEGEHGTLSYSLNGGSFINIESPSQIKVFEGDDVDIRANVDSNFMVGKWIVNSIVNQTTVKTMDLIDIDEDFDVWVEFVPMAYYQVEFYAGDGGGISATMDGVYFESGNKNIGGGTKVVFTSTPESGKMVDYWMINGEVIENEYNANYIEKTYTINGLSENTTAYVYFKDIVQYTVNTVTSRTAIQAVFNPSDQSGYTDVREGTAGIFEISPDDGYMLTEYGAIGNSGSDYNGFDRVIENNDGSLTCIIYEINDNIEVYAEAEELFSISTNANIGGNVVISKDEALKGEEITITAYPSENYIFKGWEAAYIDTTSSSAITGNVNIDDESALTSQFTMPNGDVTVDADFEYVEPIVYYNLSSTPVVGGNILLSKNSAAKGEEITITAVANANYVFNGWKVTYIINSGEGDLITEIVLNNSKSPTQTFQMVEADVTVTASFRYVSPYPTDGGGGGGGGVVAIMYAITAQAGNGGSITPMLSEVEAGGSQTFNITPKAGYTIFDVLVNGKSLGAVTSYTFNDVNSEAFIEAVFAERPYRRFIDVSIDDWFVDAVDFVIENGLFNGMTENTFSPSTSMKRGMFVTVLGRLYENMENISIETIDELLYSDVPSNEYYAPNVKWATDNSIVKGVSDTEFKPDFEITREQIATMLYRYSSFAGVDTSMTADITNFKDNSEVSTYAVDSVKWAVGSGLLKGRLDGALDPQGNVLRSEVAAILQRFVENLLK